MAKNEPQQASPVVVLLLTAADTTWRMFLPIIGATFAGIGLDTALASKPIATIICIIVGVGLSTLLVLRQIQKVNTSNHKEK